jgi:hypothetical protein
MADEPTLPQVVPAPFVERAIARQRAHEAQLLEEQLRVVRVTMRTVQDIVNNGLNSLQLLRLEAEACVPPDRLAAFDAIIQDIAAQLKALGNVEVFEEKRMASGPGLAFDPPRPENT